MAPVAAAAYAMIGAALVVAAMFGLVGGVLAALLKIDLALGAFVAMGAFLASAPLLLHMRVPYFGLLPLLLVFLAAALTTGAMQKRGIPRPLAALMGLLAGVAMSFAYGIPLRYRVWLPVEVGTAWVALAIFVVLAIVSVRKRAVSARSSPST